jgi:hypothetical protein
MVSWWQCVRPQRFVTSVFIQQVDVEHIMQFGARRKLKLVCDGADVFHHLDGAIVLRPQLAMALDIKRRHWTVQ